MTAPTSSTADPIPRASAGPGAHRVLWVTENHSPSRGGMAQSGDRIVRGLRRAGVEVDVAHLTTAPRRASIERGEGGVLVTWPLGDDTEDALRRLWTEVDRLHRGAVNGRAVRPYTHVVAFGGTRPLLAAPVYAAWLGVPLVTLLRGNDFDTGAFSLRRQGVLLEALRRSRAVAVVASAYVEQVRALAPGVEVRWITNGIDLTGWSALPSDRERGARWRAEHVAPDAVLVAMVGQLKAKKGAGLLLEAARRATATAPLHLLLVGDADPDLLATADAGEAEHGGRVGDGGSAAAAAGLAVTHLPFLDRFELLHLYLACDLVALPSYYDGLPNVALEAGALGVPLLTSDAGGLADLVVDGEHGYVFAAGDAGGARAALDRAQRDSPAERGRRGAALRERISTAFSAGRETESYRALLDHTAGPIPDPAPPAGVPAGSATPPPPMT